MQSTKTESVVNDTIRAELARFNRSQQELADFLDVSASAVSRRLTSDYAWKISDLVRIGDWLGLNLIEAIHVALAFGEIQ